MSPHPTPTTAPTTTRAAIVAQALTWLDVRWQHQGRSRAGVDCIGLVIALRRELLGLQHDVTGYTRTTSDEAMLLQAASHLRALPYGAPWQPGDVLVLGFHDQRHMGLVAPHPAGAGLSLIHAYLPARRVVQTRLDSVWRQRTLGAFAWPELADEPTAGEGA